MGRKSAQMLIDRLELEDEEDEHYKTELIETNLIFREFPTGNKTKNCEIVETDPKKRKQINKLSLKLY